MHRFTSFGLCLWLAGAASAYAAQQPKAPEPDAAPTASGTVAFGGRVHGITGDPARNQRYRDLRDGPVIDVFRYNIDKRSWRFDASADHVGYRDQQYAGSLEKLGAIKASFSWNSIPLFNSADTR